MNPKKKKKIKKGEHHKSYLKQQRILKKCDEILNDELLKRKEDMNDKYSYLFTKILLNTDKLWLPNKKNSQPNKFINDINSGIENTSHSWFDITEYLTDNHKEEYNINIDVPIVDELVKCEKIKMYPTDTQRKILLKWMDSYNKMYNQTIKLFKEFRFNKSKYSIDWKRIRTDHLTDVKRQILNKSELEIEIKGKKKKVYVNSHILDFAIQDACAKYKSCLSNLRNGNIKRFRLRYLKQTKESFIVKIEKKFINSDKNTFCSTVFTESFKLQDNFQLKNIKSDFTIHYNRKKDEFTLLNPIKIKQSEEQTKNESIALDPGLRAFLTGFSNSKCVKIGSNLTNKILKYTKGIDKLNNGEIKKKSKIKEKLLRKYYTKISNTVDDLHWKTINYLTNNYSNILIGNMSTKRIINNESNTQLDSNIKRVAQHMSLYKFKQRLAYKCSQKRVGYCDVDEAYTTMTCTRCGFMNDVKDKKKIKCLFCKLRIDRDFAGARNIMLRGTDS